MELRSPWMTYTQPIARVLDVVSSQLNHLPERSCSGRSTQRATSRSESLAGLELTVEQLTWTTIISGGSLRRTGQELQVSESAFNAWGRQLRRRGSAEFLEGIGVHMMYTITRGPSKLVTQRRTGEWMWPLPNAWCNVTSGCFWLKKAKVSGLFRKVKCLSAGLHRVYKRVIFPFLPQVTLSRSRASSATWNWSRRPGSRQSEYVYFVFLFNVYLFFFFEGCFGRAAVWAARAQNTFHVDRERDHITRRRGLVPLSDTTSLAARQFLGPIRGAISWGVTLHGVAESSATWGANPPRLLWFIKV